MSNYTKSTNFTAKDSLPSGDSAKIIRGAEFDTEFNAISTAVATKADTASPTITGTLSATTITASGTITAASLVASGSAAVGSVIFEGSTADAFETTLNVVDPTADRSILLPNKSGTVALTSDIPNVSISTKTGTYSMSGSTTLTVTSTAHGFVVGNIVYLSFSSGTAVDGEFTVATAATNSFTVTYGSSLTTSGNVSASYSPYGLSRIASMSQVTEGTSTDTFVSPYTLQQTKLVQATAVASTSGTSIDFTSIPSWVKRITVMFGGVSTNGTSSYLIQLGDSGGIENSGYTGACSFGGDGATAFNSVGFIVNNSITAAATHSGAFTLALLDSNKWVGSGVLAANSGNGPTFASGLKTLSGVLTQVRITTVSADTFDAGSINILYE